MRIPAMPNPRVNAFAATALLVPLLAATALAQDASYPEGQTVGDYRFHVYVACSLVFVAITVYLVLTHGKGARLADEIAHVERRIETLEAGTGDAGRS